MFETKIYSKLSFNLRPKTPPLATDKTFLNIPSLVGTAIKANSDGDNPSE